MSIFRKSNYSEGKWRNAIVILANWADFVPGMTYSYRKVQSRFFIWSRYGSGTLTVNRRSYPLRQGDFLFLPWNHSISYRPNNENPFSLGCIHVIPDMPEAENIYYNPFHWERPELTDYSVRHDEFLEGFENTFAGHAAPDSSLLQLARYIIDSYNSHCPQAVLRTFPRLLLFELEREIESQASSNRNPCPLFSGILNKMDEEISGGKGDLKIIQAASGVSMPTLYRLFRKHLNMTPGNCLMDRKMEFCAYLLRNTRLTNREIAGKIGVSVSYFIRVFRKKYSLSPGKFRTSANICLENMELFRYRIKQIRQDFHADMKAW